MKIEFPSAGEARYSFYRKSFDNKGNVIETFLSTAAVRKEIRKELLMELADKFINTPLLPIPGLLRGVPVIVP